MPVDEPPSAVDELTLDSTRGRLALFATVAASGMAMFDGSLVNVALPTIGDDFDVTVSELQWVLTGYLLSLASFILLGGSLGDRYGRRRVFVIGTIWFAAASILCGAAPNAEVLIAARVLQGVGAALLTPGSLAILQVSFRSGDRAKAVGAWSGLSGVAGAVGPFVGGWLVDGPGWRWGFLINAPVAVVVVICAHAAIPETRDPHAATDLDLLGAGLTVVTLGAATWALTEGGSQGWSEPSVLLAIVVSVLGGIAFVRRLFRATNPLVPPSLFRSRTFSVLNVATVLLYAAVGVAFFLVAYQLQVAAGWTALEAGAALVPATILMLVGSVKSGELADRIGPRPQLVGGPIVFAVGLVLLARIDETAEWLDVLPGSVLFGIGLVTFVAPLTATVMAAVDADHVSVASGVNNAASRTAGLASLAAIPVVSGLTTAVGASETTDAFRIAMLIAAVVAVAAAPVALFGLPSKIRSRPSPGRPSCAVDGPPLQPEPLDALR